MSDYHSSYTANYPPYFPSRNSSRVLGKDGRNNWNTEITSSETTDSDDFSQTYSRSRSNSSVRRSSFESGRLSRRNSMPARSRRSSFSHSLYGDENSVYYFDDSSYEPSIISSARLSTKQKQKQKQSKKEKTRKHKYSSRNSTHIQGSVFNVALHCEKKSSYSGNSRIITKVTKTVRDTNLDDGVDHVSLAVERAESATDVVSSFCEEVDTQDYSISVVVPKVMKIRKTVRLTHRKSSSSLLQMLDMNSHGNGRQYRKTKTVTGLVETYVPNLKMYDAASGSMSNGDGFPESLLRLLTHYSYYWSGRKFTLSSFYASIDRKHKQITIVSPNIFSKHEGQYGVEDSGANGIRHLFSIIPSSPTFRWSGESRRYWHQFDTYRTSDNSLKIEVKNFRVA